MARHREFDEALVVDRAMELFWLQGYRDATPQKLVDATGLSKSSLYATFDSKQGLFLAALARYIQGQVAQIRAVTANGSLRDGLTRLYDAIIDMAVGGRTCLLCSSSVQAPIDHPDVAALIAKGQQQVEQALFDRLERARSEGELSADRDPRALARFLVSSNMGLMVLGRTHPDPDRLRPIAAEVVRAVC